MIIDCRKTICFLKLSNNFLSYFAPLRNCSKRSIYINIVVFKHLASGQNPLFGSLLQCTKSQFFDNLYTAKKREPTFYHKLNLTLTASLVQPTFHVHKKRNNQKHQQTVNVVTLRLLFLQS